MAEMIDCMVLEIAKTAREFDETIHTIYFGGGTPSLLSAQQLEELLEAIHSGFKLDLSEVSFEANPEDLTFDYIRSLKALGIDRLSIGIQTFHDPLLEFINRNHSSEIATRAYDRARDQGFENINLDLIYALPGSERAILTSDLRKLSELDPEHISIYAYTVEKRTVFENWLSKGKINLTNEDEEAEQFNEIARFLGEQGYDHYEVSNFSKPGFYSRHNSAYWNLVPYLGIGPSAHSYRKDQRWKNAAHNAKYIRAIKNGALPREFEERGPYDECNEYIFTSMRTIWGCDLNLVKSKWGHDLLSSNKHYLQDLRESGMLEIRDERLVLTEKGFLFADSIAGELFFV